LTWRYFDCDCALSGHTTSEEISIAIPTENPSQAIATAIGFEKDSILFYEAMRQLVRSSEAKTIDEVIFEALGLAERE